LSCPPPKKKNPLGGPDYSVKWIRQSYTHFANVSVIDGEMMLISKQDYGDTKIIDLCAKVINLDKNISMIIR